MVDLQGVEPLLRAALAEDIGPGDVTTALFVEEDARGRAEIVAKAPGVIAGVEVASAVLRLATAGDLDVLSALADGTRLSVGTTVLLVEGQACGLLRGERTALNFLARLSGIATLTARFVEAVAGTGARILDTRKTTPGLRALEKYAVRAGGGENHRHALYDAVLVKENHLAFGAELRSALGRRPAGMPAIVEAEDLDEFRSAMAAGADVVLLDDFAPARVAEALRMRGRAVRPLLEVSGGVTLDNVRSYAEAGAERISVGALTHSAPALDLSLRVRPISR